MRQQFTVTRWLIYSVLSIPVVGGVVLAIGVLLLRRSAKEILPAACAYGVLNLISGPLGFWAFSVVEDKPKYWRRIFIIGMIYAIPFAWLTIFFGIQLGLVDSANTFDLAIGIPLSILIGGVGSYFFLTRFIFPRSGIEIRSKLDDI
jgi:hypothetical protein